MAMTTNANFWPFLTYIITITLLIRFLFKIFIAKPKNNKDAQHHPPSPPSLPIIGHLKLLGFVVSHQSLRTLCRQYGPFLRIFVGPSEMIVVGTAAAAKEVLKTHDLTFAERPKAGGEAYDIYEGNMFSLARYGAYWRFLKKLCMTEILSTPQILLFTDVRRQEVIKMMTKFGKCAEKGEACDLGFMLMNMTNNIICRLGFSQMCSANSSVRKEIRVLTKGIGEVAVKLSLGDALGPLQKYDLFGHGKKLKEMMLKFDRLMDGIMVEKEKENPSGERETAKVDMLDILLKYCTDENAEVKITRSNIKAFFLDLFIAGTDTTSVGLQWTIARLITNPKAFKKLREEIDTVVGSSRVVEESDVPKLVYLQAVIKEALRMNPPLPLIFRNCRNDCKINGYDVALNARLVINVYGINRDPDLWENPDDFIPERFLNMSAMKTYKSQQHLVDIKGQNFDYSYLSFGGGRRGCPGAGLASAILHVTIAAMVQCFDWEIDGDKVGLMDEGSGFSVTMARPLVCYPIARMKHIF